MMKKRSNTATRKVAEYDRFQELHQETANNFNYVLVQVNRHQSFQERKAEAATLVGTGLKTSINTVVACSKPENQDGITWTVFTKTPDCKRGEYAEEIDIATTSDASISQVKRIANAVIAAEYDNNLKVSKIIKRFGMFT